MRTRPIVWNGKSGWTEEEPGAAKPRFGFCSHGEILPHAKSGICELHHRTMRVTTPAEAA
jgi:hypothetical protein